VRKLLAGDKGAHDEFMVASRLLQQKHGQYTDEELAILQNSFSRSLINSSSSTSFLPSSPLARLLADDQRMRPF
jgi:hypothetical protein